MDASINSLAHEIMQQLPALIDQRIAATKVQFDVDEPSMKKVKSKISELFSSLGRWGNKKPADDLRSGLAVRRLIAADYDS